METNSSNLISTSGNYDDAEFIYSIDNKFIFVLQVVILIYTFVCFFWLVYVVFKLIALVRSRRSLINLSYLNTEHDYKIRLFMHRETILRNSVFLVFLCFELAYCLMVNLGDILSIFLNYQDTVVLIGHNCTLVTWTYLSTSYDKIVGMIMLNVILAFGPFLFSMMIWLFGVSLLHLSFAARNELRVKAVIRYILLGLAIYILLITFVLIPYTSIFGVIARSVMDQISILVVLYIAKKKFFPAMNSRVIDAFHFNNVRVYLEQKSLLKMYKALIWFLLFTFEIYVLKNLIFYNLDITLESISQNPCWFRVTYHLPQLRLTQSTNDILFLVSIYFSVLTHLADMVVYTNLIFVNLTLIYNATKIHFKIFCKKKRPCYRYQILSVSLLSDNK